MASYKEYAARKKEEGGTPISKKDWQRRYGAKQAPKPVEKPKPVAKAKAAKPKPAAKPVEKVVEKPKPVAKPKTAKPKGMTGTVLYGPIARGEQRIASALLRPLLGCVRRSPSKDATLALKDAHRALTLYKRRQSFQVEDLTGNIRKGAGLLKGHRKSSDKIKEDAKLLLEYADALEAELKKRE